MSGTVKPSFEELANLYKDAYLTWKSLAFRYDGDWIQEYENEKKYPCEVCVKLHAYRRTEDNEKLKTCKTCDREMCDVGFREMEFKDDECCRAWCSNCKDNGRETTYVGENSNDDSSSEFECDIDIDKICIDCLILLCEKGKVNKCIRGCCFSCVHEHVKNRFRCKNC